MTRVCENALLFGDPFTPSDACEFAITIAGKVDRWLELAGALP